MIREFSYYVPVKLVFGEGKLETAGEEAKIFGKKALIVTTGDLFKKSGLVDRLAAILAKSGVSSAYYNEISPNPLHTEIDAGAAFAKTNGCDLMIGLGGGSAIDSAKGMAIALGHGRPIWDFCMGPNQAQITAKTLPIIAITTTSGTGSEGTQWAVITNKATKEKPGIGSDFTFAKVAIVDPELMATMPQRITASTGFDALAHSIEAYTSTLSNALTDMYCEKAIRLIGRYLRRAVKDGSDREARNGMALANTLGGFSIAVAIVTVCHGLAHTVGGVANTTHGESLAAMTPQTMRFSMRGNPDKFKNIGMFLRDEVVNCGQDRLEDSVREVERLIADIGLNNGLAKQGVKESDIELIAENVIRYMGGSIEIDPMNPTKKDLVEILRKSM
ncbi:MAG: iron-containing alcohol dehydrogenase [Rectinemataceae bacterium]|jgi:alcohol dehydrogenase